MNSTKDIQKNLKFLKKGEHFNEDNIVAYIIDGKDLGDKWENIAVIFNANDKDVEVKLPYNNWNVVVNENSAGVETLGQVNGNKVKVAPNSAYVLYNTSEIKEGIIWLHLLFRLYQQNNY
jgi:pullulanase